MTCTKRKCVGINSAKNLDNHRWFSGVHANTLLSCGVNPWSPTLTKVLLEHKQPSLACGESCFHQRDPAALGQHKLLQAAPGDHTDSLCSCHAQHSLTLSSWSSDYVFATFCVLSSVGWKWALLPFDHSAGQGVSAGCYKGWMWKADACWEI